MVVLLARVTCSLAPPTGTVQFRDDTTTLGTTPVVAHTAVLPIHLKPGLHHITATYNGNFYCQTATSTPTTVTISRRQ